MFLKRLYYHSKVVLTAFVLFIAAFIYINYKWGIVATPVYQFGMFSGKQYMKDSLKAVRFVANGNTVNLASLSFPVRDQLTISVQRFMEHTIINSAVEETIKNIFCEGDANNKIITNALSIKTDGRYFHNSLKKQLSCLLDYEVNDLQVFTEIYIYNNSKPDLVASKEILF